MWRLLLDQLRRSAVLYVGGVGFIALIWVLPSETFSARWVVAWSLVVVYFTGPIRSFVLTSNKEMALLPVSWRERWRAQWIMEVIFPLMVIALGQALGVAIAAAALLPAGHAEAFVLSMVCCTAYLGFATGLNNIFSIFSRKAQPLTSPPKPRDPRLATLLIILVFAQFTLVFLGGLSGFIFYRSLPDDLSALRGVLGAVIGTGIGVGVWTWFFYSSLGARPYLFARVPSRATSAATSPLPREAQGPSGVRGLFEYGAVKACKHALVCAAIALPFLFLVENRNMVKVFWAVLVFVVGGLDWQSRLRHLRQLPISVLTLNVAMISTTVTVWVVTAILMTAAAFIAPSRADAIPFVPVFSVVIGAQALLESVRLRNRRSDYAIVAAIFVSQYFVPWHALSSLPVPLLVYGGSLAALAGAAVINHHTLTRSSTAYKPRPARLSPFGVAQTR